LQFRSIVVVSRGSDAHTGDWMEVGGRRGDDSAWKKGSGGEGRRKKKDGREKRRGGHDTKRNASTALPKASISNHP
jgi:hypothetical protein